MKKLKTINDLLNSGGKRLATLKAAQERRSTVLEHVMAALPPEMAAAVVSAGMEGSELTVGVDGGNWATRVRYATETLRTRVSGALGVEIQTVRIKVVRPRV